jgi:hypothetical protein
MTMKRQCKQCKEIFEGRLNKEFCSTSCKSTYNNQLARIRNKNLKQAFDKVKHNKNALRNLYQLFGNSAISGELLERAGLQPAYTSVQLDQNVLVFDDWALKPVSNNKFQIIKLP